MKIVKEQYIWSEKYRPQVLEDLIITNNIKNQLKENIKEKNVPHLFLISNSAGLGKTTLARILSRELNSDTKFINGSQDRGLDIFRNQVRDFITSSTFDDSKKMVIIDEADGLTSDSNKAIRGLIEEFSKNTIFIFTANYEDMIIEPLKNRLVKINFDEMFQDSKNKPELGLKILERLKFILDNENVKYKVKDLKTLITNFYPSIRSMILTLQQSVKIENGNKFLELSQNILNINDYMKNFMEKLKQKDYKECRNIILSSQEPRKIYSYIFKNIESYFEGINLSKITLLCATYLENDKTCRDKHLNACAFVSEILIDSSITFKG